MRLRWTKRAERDLDEIAKYIGQDSPAEAARVVLELIDQVEANLLAHPAIGRPGRVSPDRQKLMEASGNEGASYERSYHRAAVVLWRRDRYAATRRRRSRTAG